MPSDEKIATSGAHTDWTRRRLLQAAVGAGSTVSAGAWSAEEPARTANAAGRAMMFDITVRIPPGMLDAWEHFWGDENVPALEANGQWLWGAWSSLTGQQNTITHEWAYRDLAHYQDMAKMRASNPQISALLPKGVSVEENVVSSVMTPLPYHPAEPYVSPAGQMGIIATHRIIPERAGASDYISMAADYVARAARHGARLVGAYQSFFGWTPSYHLQVWRFEGFEQYLRARQAIEADPKCQQLLTGMRSLFPHESVELHRPMRYSRIR
jgi:hypothetical protein